MKFAVEARIFTNGMAVYKIRPAEVGEESSTNQTMTCEIWIDVFDTEQERESLPRDTGGHKKSFYIRCFRCPECGHEMYAPKKSTQKTKLGHLKYLWCPWCKAVRNMEQVG